MKGLASAGLEGGVGLDFEAKLAGVDATHPLVNIHQIEAYEAGFTSVGDQAAENAGFVGPLQLKASGYAYLDFVYKSFWGLGPHGRDQIAHADIFNYPDPAPLAQDIGPLGYYNPQSGVLTLYMGPLSSQRDGGTETGTSLDNATGPDDVAAASATTYSIDVDGNNRVVIHYHNPKTGLDETQTPSGPVRLIKAQTGSGDNTININNTAPNTVQVDFEGASGGKVYNPGATSTSAPTAMGVEVGGTDVFHSAGGSATMVAADGDSQLYGSANADSLTGGAGNDRIISNGGNDTIAGGAGNDFIALISGNIILDGGDGQDTVDFTGVQAAVVANLATGTLALGNAANGHIKNAETLIGTPFDDTLVGTSATETLDGRGGNDSIVGNGGADSLYGGDGNDTIIGGDQGASIIGGTGNDSITAGIGNDTIDASDPNNEAQHNALLDGNDFVDAGGGADRITVGYGTDQVYGGEGDDTILAGDGSDHIEGGGGADSITVGDGTLVVYGDAAAPSATDGADFIKVGNGSDSIYGGGGNDTISAGTGNDTIEGDAGADKITTTGLGKSLIYGDAAVTAATDGADFDHRGQRRRYDLWRRRQRYDFGRQRQ